MNENKNKIINFTNIEEYNHKDNNNNLSINKINTKKITNSIDMSNSEIDFSLKNLKQKKILNKNIKKLQLNNINSFLSKNIKNESIITLPCSISSSKRKLKYFPEIKKIYRKKKFDNSQIKKQNDSQDNYIKYSTESNAIDINSFLDKITKYNEHSYFKIGNKKKERKISKSSKILSIDYYNAFQCLFCEQIFKVDEITKLIKCEHKFCNKCGEYFYYDLINKGYFTQNFKCPYFKCNKEISYNVIELLISKNYDTLRINQIKQDNEMITNRNFIYREKENNINYNLINNNIIERNDKILKNKNIVDINNLNSNYIFYLQSKKSLILCPECGQNALYKNASKYFLKCLYCKNKFCKFCVKLLTENHFSKDNIQRCRVFFRINQFHKKNIFLIFIKQIFLIIAGYLFLMSFFINKIKNIYHNKSEISIISKLIISIFYFGIFIINIPFFIVIIPYYPILSCL